eukprot:scaffold110495_cov40-Phaeocystis_antarctica.AAC.3
MRQASPEREACTRQHARGHRRPIHPSDEARTNEEDDKVSPKAQPGQKSACTGPRKRQGRGQQATKQADHLGNIDCRGLLQLDDESRDYPLGH